MSLADELRKLHDLHSAGAITRDEWDQLRAGLLGSSPRPADPTAGPAGRARGPSERSAQSSPGDPTGDGDVIELRSATPGGPAADPPAGSPPRPPAGPAPPEPNPFGLRAGLGEAGKGAAAGAVLGLIVWGLAKLAAASFGLIPRESGLWVVQLLAWANRHGPLVSAGAGAVAMMLYFLNEWMRWWPGLWPPPAGYSRAAPALPAAPPAPRD